MVRLLSPVEARRTAKDASTRGRLLSPEEARRSVGRNSTKERLLSPWGRGWVRGKSFGLIVVMCS
jgi:hypothetical protein